MDALRRYPLVLATIAVGIGAGAAYLLGHHSLAQWLATGYVAGVIAWVSVGMVRDIMWGHWGLDILAVVAMAATLATGEYAAALIVALMLTGGEALEDYAEHRARRELTALLDRAPDTAHLLPAAGTAPRDVPADEVVAGDLLLIRPAEIVPVDVELVTDSASFDTSSITGESLPVTFTAGAEVPSGAVNGTAAVTGVALRPAAESQYQRIISLVHEAQASKAPLVRLADRFAVPFTVFALVLAGAAWAISGNPTRFAEVLVLATPCPLLIAAPVAFLGGLSQSAKNGVIVKGGSVLEALARTRSAAFDKTGTLTQGRPELVRVDPAPGVDADDLLRCAAAAEQYSTHVFAAGIITAARDHQLQLPPAVDAREVATHGVQARVEGRTVRVGKRSFIEEATGAAISPAAVEPGQAHAFVAIDGAYAGALTLADPVRQEAAPVVSWLRDLGVRQSMLTGDGHATAASVAEEVGITDVHAELLPEDKVRLIGQFPHPVLMVGDGVNDAPVLAAADVGIAMGAKGATAAGEAADAVILHDDLSRVVDTVHIARHTVSVALTAIWIGIGLSVGLMLIAATGAIPAVIGALTQEFVDLAAILYALRARRARPVFRRDSRQETPRRVSQHVG